MYEKKNYEWAKYLDFIVLEILCMQVSLTMMYFLRYGEIARYHNIQYLNLSIVLALANFISIIFLDSYKNVLQRGYFEELKSTIKSNVSTLMFVLFYMFLTQKSDQFSRMIIIFLPLCNLILNYIIRIFWKKYILFRTIKSRIKQQRSIMLITTYNQVYDIVENINKDKVLGVYISSICLLDCDMIGKEIKGIPVIAKASTIIDYIKSNVVDEVFVSATEKDIDISLFKILRLAGIVTHISIIKTETALATNIVEQWGQYTVVTSSINIVSKRDKIIKRSIDIVGSLVGLILTALISIVIIPIIYIQSPGSIFYSQERVGKGGRKFKIYKFRSMYPDADKRKKELMKENSIEDERMFKMPDDPRIYPFGRIIRKYSLDEFPQFLNVLKGDMSLVGTRPPTVDEYERYELHHRSRLAIQPGITGMWQVSGRSKIKNFEDVVKLDNKYIKDWSLGLDIKILLATIKVVVMGDGGM